MLKKLLLRKNKQENTQNLTISDTANERIMELTPYIEDIENILLVKCPKIELVACIFNGYNPAYKQNMIMCMTEFSVHDIPQNASFIAAYYLDEVDTIYIATRYAVPDPKSGVMHYKKLTSAEHLFHIAHELRHVWQKQYASSTYYKHNAVEMECIEDIAEIDADAFALSYVFSEQTPFSYDDVPTIAEEIVLKTKADKGRRWIRAKKLVKDYNFVNDLKKQDLESLVDSERIALYIDILKINHVI